MGVFWKITIPGAGTFDIEVSDQMLRKLDHFCRMKEKHRAEVLGELLESAERFFDIANGEIPHPMVALVNLLQANTIEVGDTPTPWRIHCDDCGTVAYTSEETPPGICWLCNRCARKAERTENYGTRNPRRFYN